MPRIFLLLAFAFLPAVAGFGQPSEFDSWAETHDLMGYAVSLGLEDGNPTTVVGGWRDLERQLPVEPHTVFRVASISKAVTSLGFFHLWMQGQIGLDDDINTWLNLDEDLVHPSFPNVAITPRMLLTHTSGLRDGTGYGTWLNDTYASADGAAIPSLAGLLHPDGPWHTLDMWGTEPGTYFAYANVNFGTLATVMEAVTGVRFDVWMKATLFDALGINASFNVLDLDNIDDVAVLYRNLGGWVAQADNYGGVPPEAPNLEGYVPGTNGARFAPQGGLRCSAEDLLDLVSQWALRSDGSSPASLFPAPVVAELRTPQWAWSGANGSTYGGLFEAWAHGLHLDEYPSEHLPFSTTNGSMWGHPGEAYGLISGAYHVTTNEGCRFRFSYLINGVGTGPVLGEDGWYTVENDLHGLLGQWAHSACATANVSPVNPHAPPSELPTFELSRGMPLPDALATAAPFRWVDLGGKGLQAVEGTRVPSLPAGMYVLLGEGGARASVRIVN